MTFETIAAKLADYKGIDVATITMDSTFEDLALDSLDVADLVMQIEDEMGISIELDPEVKDMRALVAKIDEAKSSGMRKPSAADAAEGILVECHPKTIALK